MPNANLLAAAEMRAVPIRRSRSAPEFPPAVAAPVENALGAAGTFAQRWSESLSTRHAAANSRARPWLEFADLSAFGLAEGGFAAYMERVQINARYFLFNYLKTLKLVLLLPILSTLTMHDWLIVGIGIGALLPVWICFQLFWAEHTNDHTIEEVHFLGLSEEQVDVTLVLGSLCFWFLAGGLSMLLSIITATVFIIIIHSALRKKPSPEYTPIVVPTA